jgi:hypothetical protein
MQNISHILKVQCHKMVVELAKELKIAFNLWSKSILFFLVVK